MPRWDRPRGLHFSARAADQRVTLSLVREAGALPLPLSQIGRGKGEGAPH
jgi:hypothetical protein